MAHSSQRLGKVMLVFGWILVLAMLTWIFNSTLEHRMNPNQHVQGNILSDGTREVTLRSDRSGHYITSGEIHGEPVVFLLDTGATHVAVPAGVAERLNLEKGMAMRANTANGVITVYATLLDQVRLGTIELQNVRASINPHMEGEEILLGMSFLRHLEFTQRDDTLTLRQSM